MGQFIRLSKKALGQKSGQKSLKKKKPHATLGRNQAKEQSPVYCNLYISKSTVGGTNK
ncbi:MAG: hypothetical protein HLUCCA11_08370 [Phormidesmis priestleyi Ana]|uniref:Uncharacterized protein n=1 Tax=Phormidesmis priestleyi Ana TaxID=1666911 RepID=A0A0P7ZLP9_9CYAN|nr:MAG: hypothetical protein HLUCCA11_08370 [Phormidesmis priestleyi Ana]